MSANNTCIKCGQSEFSPILGRVLTGFTCKTKSIKNHWQFPGFISLSIGTPEFPPGQIRHAKNNEVILEINNLFKLKENQFLKKINWLFIFRNIELHIPKACLNLFETYLNLQG